MSDTATSHPDAVSQSSTVDPTPPAPPAQSAPLARTPGKIEAGPSVGRVVHYWPRDPDICVRKAQQFPAIITHVNEDGSVNLSVFGDGEFGTPDGGHPTRVVMGIRSGTWSWPHRVYDTKALPC